MKYRISESKLLDFFNGVLSPEEENAVWEWAKLNEENRMLFDQMKAAHFRVRWINRAPLINGTYADFEPKMKLKKNRIRRITAVAAAACVLVVASVLLLTRYGFDSTQIISGIGTPRNNAILELSDGTRHSIGHDRNEFSERDGTRLAASEGEVTYDTKAEALETEEEPIYNKFIVPRGAGTYSVTLCDGTRVWLNSDSELEYPLSFAAVERTVFLKGEAFFDVTADEGKPFIVKTDMQSVSVLGTEFVISAYSQEPTLTTLVSGKVKVMCLGGGDEAVLHPGEQAMLASSAEKFALTDVITENYTSWKDGVISIERMPLDKILNTLERRYDVRFDTGNLNLNNIVLQGSISMDENFDVILTGLKQLVNVEFKMRADGKIKVVKY